MEPGTRQGYHAITLGLAGYALLVAFGVRVWRSTPGNRRLRVVGRALVVFGVLALWAVPFASMHVRGAERSLTDTMHLVDGAIAVLLLVVAIGFGATAFGQRYRLYSIATILVLVAFGAWAGMDGPRIAEGLPTPWIGIKERISAYSYQLWLVVLAIALLPPTTKPKYRGPCDATVPARPASASVSITRIGSSPRAGNGPPSISRSSSPPSVALTVRSRMVARYASA